MYTKLLQPYTFKSGVAVKNRLMMAPMTTFSADANDFVSDEELAYYEKRANGVGAIITACAYVSANGKGFEGQMGIHDDETIPKLKTLAQTIQKGGAKGIVQLYHGGRLAVPHLIPNGETVSASAVKPLADRGFYSIDVTPRALTTEEVYEIINDFGEATRRTIEAGFDGIELHGATGYLLQQFVSPHSNLRTDEFKDRYLFAQKLIEKVKEIIKQYAEKPFLIGYRFSPEEPEKPGITMKETFELIDVLLKEELDYLHIATTNAWAKPRSGNFDKSRTEVIAAYVNNKIPVIGVGNIHTPEEAVELMEKGNVDFVSLGRALVVEPYWVEKMEMNKAEEIRHSIDPNMQKDLEVPDPLWKLILEIDGWFQVQKVTV